MKIESVWWRILGAKAVGIEDRSGFDGQDGRGVADGRKRGWRRCCEDAGAVQIGGTGVEEKRRTAMKVVDALQ